MSSTARPTSAQTTRRLLVLAAALFAVIIGQTQQLIGWGQTPAEFAADSDATLKVAGWAFAIWGLIYLGLIIHAVRQALPRTPETDILNRLGWPSLIALLGIGWWVVAAALDAEIATIVLIFGSMLILVAPLLINARTIRGLSRKDPDRWMTVWPLALLAGWLSIASPLNLITVATGNGWLPEPLSPTLWAMAAIVLVAALALFVTLKLRLLAFAIPISWGLLGAFAAEQERNPSLAFFALAAAVAVIVGAVLLVFRAPQGARPAAL